MHNRAGRAADRYVVAPGTIVTSGIDDIDDGFSGTSAAAPVVTALAADILSKWPHLSGRQAGEIILETARDLGAPGVDPVYGHGLVDFRAALSPVNPTLSNGVAQTSIENAVMVVPEGVNASLIQTALAEVTVLDAFGRDFSGSLAGLVIKPDDRDGQWLRRRIGALTGGGMAAVTAGTFSASVGYARGPVDSDGYRLPATSDRR